MNDSFLNDLRQPPSPEFAERLRVKLHAQPPAAAAPPSSWLRSPLVISMASVVVITALFTVPAVRASARAFLDLFRVVNFVAVPVDSSRGEAVENLLKSNNLDLSKLIGEQVTILSDPGPPTTVTSVGAASSAIGAPVSVPSVLPSDQLVMTRITVSGERAVRVVLNTERVQQVLDALNISDIEVSPAWNGQSATIRIPSVVEMVWERGESETPAYRRVSLIQVQNPVVDLPEGVALATFGEIGLRVLGLDAVEARRLAGEIDWASTLVVPVPPTVADFRHVDIHGARGLAMETERRPDNPPIRMVLWSAGGRVYGVLGLYEMNDMLAMANSVQ
jgi:hypothetical protein